MDGNGGYDVRSYHLELKYDPATDLLEGRAKIRAKATQNLSSLNLDLVGLTVHSVTVNKREPASFGRDGGELTITPEGGLRQNRTFTVVVDYSGVPNHSRVAGFIHTDDGALVAGEPHSAASWFPVNDHPTDKASYTSRSPFPRDSRRWRTAPSSASGRRRVDDLELEGEGAMASYLTTATIGEFDLRAYREKDIRFWDAVDPDLSVPLGSLIDAAFALQPEIVEFHEDHLGKYPFLAGGGIVDDFEGLGFALENQTRPIYAMEFFDDPQDAERRLRSRDRTPVVRRQPCAARWKHIWLNEGFATYMTWLWREEKHGYPAQESFDLYYFGIPLEDEGGWKGFWQGIVGDPGPDEIFGLPVYIRGAMTLHQLRLAVGDPAFFATLKRWTQERKGDNVTTDEFIALAEKVSGAELDDLFETWLFTPGRPELPESLGVARASASGAASAMLLRPHGMRR